MTLLNLMLGSAPADVKVTTAIVAGWTGRDRAAVESHISELEELGVKRPSTTPIFYRVSAPRVLVTSELEAPAASSGEVEPVLLRHGGRLWVGTGSDHTDRAVESYSVAVSKQLCDKPLAQQFWPYDEVADHWDELIIRSWIDDEVLYQEGSLKTLISAEALQRLAQPQLQDGTIMFCGTCAVKGGIRSSPVFRYELEDPILNRKLEATYRVLPLPLVS